MHYHRVNVADRQQELAVVDPGDRLPATFADVDRRWRSGPAGLEIDDDETTRLVDGERSAIGREHRSEAPIAGLDGDGAGGLAPRIYSWFRGDDGSLQPYTSSPSFRYPWSDFVSSAPCAAQITSSGRSCHLG